MLRITLSADEPAALEQVFKTTADRGFRKRCQAVLMAHRGRKRKAIAQDLGVHRTTVKKWLVQYQACGVEGLKRRRAPGTSRRIPETFAATIVEWVKGGPQRWGLNRANWTSEEVAVPVDRTTGITSRRTALRDVCQRYQIRPSRPTSRSLRGAPQRQAATKAELAELKNRPKPGRVSW